MYKYHHHRMYKYKGFKTLKHMSISNSMNTVYLKHIGIIGEIDNNNITSLSLLDRDGRGCHSHTGLANVACPLFGRSRRVHSPFFKSGSEVLKFSLPPMRSTWSTKRRLQIGLPPIDMVVLKS